ncbi:MAG: type IV pilin protein [Leucothrix sp.]
MKTKETLGFSLIELMMTVAILGIISTIAVPSYMAYVTKSKRTEAKTELLRIAQLQESYYVQNLSYAKALNGAGGLGFTGASTQTETDLYTVTTTGVPATCDGTNTKPCTGYDVLAVPVNGKGQEHDKKCGKGFTINNTGQKGAKGATDTDFTSASTIKTCWN